LINENLKKALKWFEENNVIHGVAVCLLTYALFLNERTDEFAKVLQLNELQIH
jgi:hypothetical protein